MAEVLEGEVRVHREADGRVVIDQAPPVARMSLKLLVRADPVTVQVNGDRITLGGQVAYRVIGWDQHSHALVMQRSDAEAAGQPANLPPGMPTKGA
jgi:hypothetical protein